MGRCLVFKFSCWIFPIPCDFHISGATLLYLAFFLSQLHIFSVVYQSESVAILTCFRYIGIFHLG
uniref:Uncharacterized protein n=1 Tax=Anguilla anguilla TaxID=7936 RepID=A0A0E9XD73_ANGAN